VKRAVRHNNRAFSSLSKLQHYLLRPILDEQHQTQLLPEILYFPQALSGQLDRPNLNLQNLLCTVGISLCAIATGVFLRIRSPGGCEVLSLMYFKWRLHALYRDLHRIFRLNSAAYFHSHAYDRRIIRRKHVQIKTPRHMPRSD
jgi:hypothetical protein